MKKNVFILFMFFLFCNCQEENSNSTPEENPKTKTVKIGFSGEIKLSEEPLARSTNDDLYGIQVWSKFEDRYYPYAYGLFDDLSNLEIDLVEGNIYKFQATVVIDGKNKVKSYKEWYHNPFSLEEDYEPIYNMNEFIFSQNYLKELNEGYTSLAEGGSYRVAPVERFYGELIDYSIEGNENILIDLKRVSFGLKIIANNLVKGKLLVRLLLSPEIELTSENNEFESIYTFSHPMGTEKIWTADDYFETWNVSIIWQREDGFTVPYYNKLVTFKRNVRTTFEINIDDSGNDAENEISLNIINEEMVDGDYIVVD